MDPADVARLRWRVQFESLWSEDLPGLAKSKVPDHLKGEDRIQYVKARAQAQQLLKVLFPEDTDGES